MPSVLALEMELINMFMNKQNEVKNLTINADNEFILQQKQELENYKNKLDEYKILLESSKKEINFYKKEECKTNEWFDIICKK